MAEPFRRIFSFVVANVACMFSDMGRARVFTANYFDDLVVFAILTVGGTADR
jgi:hypothetical protein